MEETWKTIPHENLEKYEVSNSGKVRIKLSQHMMKPYMANNYMMCSFTNPITKNRDRILVHRLVAKAFISNPDKKKVVNHMDGNKMNNHANNLEWVTMSENTQHAINTLGRAKSNKSVYRIDDAGNKVKYESITVAAQNNNTTRENIKSCLRKKSQTAIGYKWEYCDIMHTFKEVDLSQMKIIPGYNNYYVSRDGRVYGKSKRQFLKPNLGDGYPKIMLYENVKPKHKYIHVLVAELFIPNPDKKKVVNHKDGNKMNNHVNNLEWATHSENTMHAHQTGLINVFKKITIRTDDDGIETEYGSLKEAASQNDISKSTISCAIKRTGSCGGYRWKYKE